MLVVCGSWPIQTMLASVPTVLVSARVRLDEGCAAGAP
jgi:hypothetical protein